MNGSFRGDIASRILFEDNHLLVIDKPAGLLSQGDRTGEPNVVDLLKAYRKASENKPGEAFVGLVHRLDRPVSGVMALAKTSKGARRLTEAWHTQDVEKIYLAIVSAKSAEALHQFDDTEWTVMVDHLAKDESTNVVHVVAPDRSDPKTSRKAELVCRRLRSEGNLVELQVRLGTGRGHQIRVQLAHRGLAIVGDSKYGSRERYLDEAGHPRVALHAQRLTMPHPTLKKRLSITADLPKGWPVRGKLTEEVGVHWLD